MKYEQRASAQCAVIYKTLDFASVFLIKLHCFDREMRSFFIHTNFAGCASHMSCDGCVCVSMFAHMCGFRGRCISYCVVLIKFHSGSRGWCGFAISGLWVLCGWVGVTVAERGVNIYIYACYVVSIRKHIHANRQIGLYAGLAGFLETRVVMACGLCTTFGVNNSIFSCGSAILNVWCEARERCYLTIMRLMGEEKNVIVCVCILDNS